jgi:hypothetical protein
MQISGDVVFKLSSAAIAPTSLVLGRSSAQITNTTPYPSRISLLLGGGVELATNSIISFELTGVGASQDAQLSEGDLSQNNVLTGVGASQDAQSSEGSLSQSNVLTGENSSQDSQAQTGSVGQTQTLSGDNAIQNSEFSINVVGQTHPLTGDNLSQNSESQSGAIGQSSVLSGSNAEQRAESLSDKVILNNEVSGDGATQDSLSSVGSIGEIQSVSGGILIGNYWIENVAADARIHRLTDPNAQPTSLNIGSSAITFNTQENSLDFVLNDVSSAGTHTLDSLIVFETVSDTLTISINAHLVELSPSVDAIMCVDLRQVSINANPKLGTYLRVFGDQTGMLVERKFNKNKVLIVYNSQIQNSLDVANYYIQARGLESHLIGINFSTDTVLSMVTQIGNYIDLHAIDFLILSSNTPVTIVPGIIGGVQYVGNYTTANFLSSSLFFKRQINDPNYSSSARVDLTDTIMNGGTAFNVAIDDTIGAHYRGNTGKQTYNDVIPHGRLGCPEFFTASTALRINNGETFALCQRIIDDAIWAENNVEASRRLMLGVYNRTPSINEFDQWLAKEAFLQMNVGDFDYITIPNGHSTTRTNASFFNSKSPKYSGNAKYIKNQNADNSTLVPSHDYSNYWAYVGAAVMNPITSGAIAAQERSALNAALNGQVKRGAWGYEDTSFCTYPLTIIANGGCGAIGAYVEPLDNGIPRCSQVIALASLGYSLAEINYLSTPLIHQSTATGDPLYRPFGAHLYPTLSGVVTDQPSESSSGQISQTHIMSGDGADQNAVLSGGVIESSNLLSGEGADQEGQSQSGNISQVHSMTGDDSSQNAIASDGAIIFDGSLSPITIEEDFVVNIVFGTEMVDLYAINEIENMPLNIVSGTEMVDLNVSGPLIGEISQTSKADILLRIIK